MAMALPNPLCRHRLSGSPEVAGAFIGLDRAEFTLSLLYGVDEVIKRRLGEWPPDPQGGSDS